MFQLYYIFVFKLFYLAFNLNPFDNLIIPQKKKKKNYNTKGS